MSKSQVLTLIFLDKKHVCLVCPVLSQDSNGVVCCGVFWCNYDVQNRQKLKLKFVNEVHLLT